MKYAIVADIHSNIEAFSSVMKKIKEIGVDEYVCVGDIVGYGADPGICIKTVRETCRAVVAGNHDCASVGLLGTDYFNDDAKEAVIWTKERLNQDEGDFLKGLQLTEKKEDFLLVHATPISPGEWNYIHSTFEAFRNFREFSERICFVGHSHVPIVFTFNEKENLCLHSFDAEIAVSDECRYIINVGSVGQPRDGNPRASFGIYDSSERKVKILRVEYDIQTAQKKILEAGIPKFLASRLGKGI